MKRALTQLYSSAPANLHGNTLASASFSKSSRSTPISTPKVQPQVARNGVAQPMPIPQHSMSRTLGVAATQEQQMRQQLLPTPQSLKNLCNIGETPPTSTTEDQQMRKQTATKANRADWFKRHTSDAALVAAIDGCEFNDGGHEHEWQNRVHECQNVDPVSGMPCHVGLYHADARVARELLKKKRMAFLEPTRGSKERGNEVFAALALPADGVGLNSTSQEINVTIDMKALASDSGHSLSGHLGILVRCARDAQRGEPLGSKWRKTGTTAPPPNGTELTNEALATALKSKTKFTHEEWRAFNILDLSLNHYIKSGDDYWEPDEKLLTTVSSVYGRAKLQTQLKPGDIIVHAQGVAESCDSPSPWVRPCRWATSW